MSVSALAATSGGAAVATKGKIDKSAVLRVGVPIEANGGAWFDPEGPGTSAQSPSNRLWIDLIYDTMIHNTPDGKGEPGLATKWSAPDPNTVELTLRKGVEFTDGTPFNAAAVKEAWDLLPTRVNKVPNIEAITEVEAVDDSHITLHLSSPIAQTLIDEDLKNSNFFAVPSPTAEAAGNVEAEPVGAGPYMLDSYTTGHVVLKKNPTFYDKKQQKLAGVEFIDTPVGPPSVSALQAGTIDLTWSIPPDSVETLNNTPGLVVTPIAGEGVYILGLCPTAPAFATKEARQAVQFAVDRASIDDAALAGTGPASVTPFGPSSPYYDKKLAKTYSYKPKKAEALLKKAGVEPGTKVSSVIPTQAPYPAIAEIVQSNLKDVGLDLEITQSANFAADAQSAKPDLMTVQLDPSLYSLAFAGDVTVLNNCGYNNPDLTQALNDARDSSKSAADQEAAWQTFQEILIDESPVVWLNANSLLAAETDKVQGVDIINAPYGPQISRIYMVK
jgi:peptide/nickel transport system substrate-binding protein